MSAPRPPKDYEARDSATIDFARNLVVSAGAGTGKTTLLVERIVTAIGSGIAPLSAIAAITFTDKAAGELRHRLASGLRQLRDAPHAVAERTGARPEDVARRATLAEASLDRAAVTTIHGFCADLLRAHPLESGLPPGFTVDRGLAGRRLATEEWAAFIGEELGPSGRRADLWERVLQAFDLSTLEEIARVLSGGAISEAALHEGGAPFDLAAAIGGEAVRLADEIRSAVDTTPGLTEAPRKWLAAAERALRVLATEGVAGARSAIEAFPRLNGSKPDFWTARVSPAHSEALDALVERARPFIRGVSRLDEKAQADLFDAVLPYVRRLRARQTRSGLVDFDGLLVRARDLLRDVRAVREAYKRRFRMILVDEFQDTDPIQYEIVFFLAERDGGHVDDAYETELAPGRLFIVGDPKQSIYRFRGADYAAYRRAVCHVVAQGGRTLSLTSNFRSTAAVLRPVNALFAPPHSSLWRPSDYLPRYEEIEAERDDDGGASVEVWTTSLGDGGRAGERRRAEGLALAAMVASIAGPGRAWRYDDVLVLFRGFSGLAPYLRALREADVPFVVSGGRAFFERPEIVQAMAVLRAVADPDDPVALLAYRRSPAGGVPDTELADAASGAATATPALAAADVRLETLRAEALFLPVDAAVRHVLDASGLVALSGLAFEAAQRVANLEKLALAASELSRDGRRLIETLDALEEGFEADDEGDSPLADADRDAIRVMTIHKAKGLEARVVILADTAAGRSNRGVTQFTAGLVRAGAREFVSLQGPGFQNAAAVSASLDAARHEDAEAVRLLYVALTRARDRLFVFSGGSLNPAWNDALSAWGEGVTYRTLDAPGPHARGAVAPPAGALEAVARFDAAAAAVAALAVPPFQSPSEAGGNVDATPAASGAVSPELARAVGRIVHARLAGMNSPDVDHDLREAVDGVLRSFNASPLAARLAALTVLGREIPLLLDEGDRRWRGAIDLLYRDVGGVIVVVDYKTDASDDGAVSRHAEQLGVYVRAVRRALPNERVRAELWMLRTGSVLDVP